jgi:tight adherence protein C
MLLLVVSTACLACAVFLVGEIVTQPARARLALRRRAVGYGRGRARPDTPNWEPFRDRAITPMKEWLAAMVVRALPQSSVDRVSEKLLAAGVSRTLSPKGFLALKGCGALGGAAFGLLIGVGSGAAALLLPLVFGALLFMVPDFVVGSKARRRREEIRIQLPDALDLLAVSVEAGLGFDAAIGKVTEHMDGALTDELGLMLSEMRIGESRQTALKRLSVRTGAVEVGSFARAIIQADQLGMSLGRILRVQATDTRLKRQAAAEEKAMKLPIKMLFPTVAFIFPAMFLVVLGPAFLALADLL